MSLSIRDRNLTLVGVLLAMFLGALDQTIVATALPRIAQDLGGLSRYAWVATAYLLASTVLVPVYGKLADMYSRKSIEIFAVTTFLVGSVLCGLAGEFGTLPLLGDSMNQLVIFRGIQGLGGAGLFSMAFIVIADLFPPNVRGRYQGLVGATFGLASVLGPWVGGLLTDHGGAIIPGIEGWRWVFYVNLPLGAVALWFLITRMPSLKPAGERKPLDLYSAAFLVTAVTPIVLALQLDRSRFPWTGGTTLWLLVIGAVFLILFVLRSKMSSNPVLDLSLFANRVFTTGNLAGFLLGAAFLSIVVFLPLFMVNVVGVSATGAGLSLVPLSLGVVFGASLSGQLVSAIGRYRLLMVIGGLILFVGVFLLSSMGPDVPYWRVTVYMVIAGLGVGPSLPLYTLAIQNAVDPRKIGQATTSSQFFRQIGGTIGAAVLGSVLAGSLAGSFATLAASAPSALAANLGGATGSLAREGGGQAGGLDPTTVRLAVLGAFEEAYLELEQALLAGDAARVTQLIAASPAPEEAKAQIQGAALAVLGDPAASRAFLADYQQRLDELGQRAADAAALAVRTVFADAITRLYRALLVMVALGLLVTVFIPVLELRGSNDSVAAGAAR